MLPGIRYLPAVPINSRPAPVRPVSFILPPTHHLTSHRITSNHIVAAPYVQHVLSGQRHIFLSLPPASSRLDESNRFRHVPSVHRHRVTPCIVNLAILFSERALNQGWRPRGPSCYCQASHQPPGRFFPLFPSLQLAPFIILGFVL